MLGANVACFVSLAFNCVPVVQQMPSATYVLQYETKRLVEIALVLVQQYVTESGEKQVNQTMRYFLELPSGVEWGSAYSSIFR